MKDFIKSALIRAIRTMAQAALAVIGVDMGETVSVYGITVGISVGILDIDWITVLSVSLLAAIFSILTSIATGLPEVDEDDFDDKAEQEEDDQ